MESSNVLKSGEFLVREVDPANVFIPEEYDEEQQMIAQTCKDFLDAEVYPQLDNLDKGDRELMLELLKKSGELGLMGISIPEQFGGFGQSFVTQMLAAETIGAAYSFSVAFMAHCGIGTLPIMYFGSYEQREKYVTKLASGELIGAYCLTEPGAGSDANSGKTSASLSEDGKHYILNGQKMWITNAGFADLQTVFAKVDNDRVLSAFIVAKDAEGVVIGPDEHKMGIKGSSTAQIYYNDVKVPVEDMIGKRGEGFRIALSILHMGRLKLGANVLGAAKKAINDSVQYANERKQFGTQIANFGAIKYKLAEQIIRTFAAESATYRVSKDIDDLMAQYKTEGCDIGRASIDAIAHYAVEAAILKVYGSEMLDFVADEAVQIHGGMGYSAEMAVERGYRDSRINRIFEGTNEINRILVVDTAMKRALKGDFDLFGEAGTLAADVKSVRAEKADGDFFEEKMSYIRNFKKIALLAINAASVEFGKKLVHEQEILNNIADMMMEIYVAESVALRVKKIDMLKGSHEFYKEIMDVYVYDIAAKINKFAKDAFNSMSETEGIDIYLNKIDELSTVKGVNVKASRRKLADKLIEDNLYRF
ncbi:MAG: acyl-CoA dehydrogenase family protein [Marinilabiliaceae bacterium]|jgi:alkylation response protein AidB-like acyl-CoA dehydrogenase|nr:acyl-CoA dehydrogenase family protein [Marinilabiliaceae bacterium]